jgi:regulator of protease activity HflC (stomatin/prohibitin superfamily)
MSEDKPFLSSSTKRNLAIGAAFLTVAGGVTAYRSYKIVSPNEFGVRVTAGEVQKDVVNPGWHKKYPLFDKIHTFNNNTVILEATVGDGKNTKDQNGFSAEVRLHYNIDPNAGILAFHLSEMADNNGKDLITEQMSKAMNAVVGQRTTPESLVSPADVLDAFVDQLEWRLKQNNIAVKIDTVEYLTAHVGSSSGSTSDTGLRLPVQLKKRPGQPVESMAGPSVPVQHMIITTAPQTFAPSVAAPK